MRFENIGFNSKWVADRGKEDFVKNAEPHLFEGDPNREEKLMEVHELCAALHGKPKGAEEESAPSFVCEDELSTDDKCSEQCDECSQSYTDD